MTFDEGFGISSCSRSFVADGKLHPCSGAHTAVGDHTCKHCQAIGPSLPDRGPSCFAGPSCKPTTEVKPTEPEITMGKAEVDLLLQIDAEAIRLDNASRRMQKVRGYLRDAATMIRTGRSAKAVTAYLDEAGVKVEPD